MLPYVNVCRLLLFPLPRSKSQAPGSRGKNVSKDDLGETVGRIHMQRQDFGKLNLSKSRALKADLRGQSAGLNDELPADSAASGAGPDDAESQGAAEDLKLQRTSAPKAAADDSATATAARLFAGTKRRRQY